MIRKRLVGKKQRQEIDRQGNPGFLTVLECPDLAVAAGQPEKLLGPLVAEPHLRKKRLFSGPVKLEGPRRKRSLFDFRFGPAVRHELSPLLPGSIHRSTS